MDFLFGMISFPVLALVGWLAWTVLQALVIVVRERHGRRRRGALYDWADCTDMALRRAEQARLVAAALGGGLTPADRRYLHEFARDLHYAAERNVEWAREAEAKARAFGHEGPRMGRTHAPGAAGDDRNFPVNVHVKEKGRPPLMMTDALSLRLFVLI
jgi:hypothetical protein